MTARVIDDLIANLGADLVPVHRLAPPWMRALGWLGIVTALALAMASVADLSTMGRRLSAAPDMWLSVAGSIATTVLAAVAAFELSCPDRRAAWALLPLPALVVWVGASGFGCMRPALLVGLHPAVMSESRICIGFIIGLSVPLSVLIIAMIRRACPLRPGLAATMAGLATAAASASLLTFFHDHDASAIDLASHIVAVTVVVLANQAAGGRLLVAGPPTRVRPLR